jgi:toxin ParE1/3/4
LPYTFRPLAAEDLDRIIDYSIEHFPSYASRTARELLDAFTLLGQMPTIGNPRDDLFAGCRTWSVRVFIIVYRRAESGVEILRIAHGRQLIESLILHENG